MYYIVWEIWSTLFGFFSLQTRLQNQKIRMYICTYQNAKQKEGLNCFLSSFFFKNKRFMLHELTQQKALGLPDVFFFF